MTGHHNHIIQFERQVVQEYLSGESLHGLARRYDIARSPIRIWIRRYGAGAFDRNVEAADLIEEYQARIAALERIVGKQALELEFLKGTLKRTAAEQRDYIRYHRPHGLSVAEGCRLIGLVSSIHYHRSQAGTFSPHIQSLCVFEQYSRDMIGTIGSDEM